jgi:PGF-CTERM protein
MPEIVPFSDIESNGVSAIQDYAIIWYHFKAASPNALDTESYTNNVTNAIKEWMNLSRRAIGSASALAWAYRLGIETDGVLRDSTTTGSFGYSFEGDKDANFNTSHPLYQNIPDVRGGSKYIVFIDDGGSTDYIDYHNNGNKPTDRTTFFELAWAPGNNGITSNDYDTAGGAEWTYGNGRLVGLGWGADFGATHSNFHGGTPDRTNLDQFWYNVLKWSADFANNSELKRVAELNLTVRSCDDASCDGESFIDINDISPQNLTVTDNQYFQYKVEFETDDSSYSPELYNVTINYTDITAPIINIEFPMEKTPVYRKGGEQFRVNFTYTEVHPKNYTVKIYNSSAVINHTTNVGVVGGTNQPANVSFNLNSTAADGRYNVSVEMYDNASNYNISYQNNSVVKDEVEPDVFANATDYPAGQTAAKQGETVTINAYVTDAGAGVKEVKVKVSSINATRTNVTLNQNGTNRWNYTLIVSKTGINGTFNLPIYAWDNASNFNGTEYLEVKVVTAPPPSSPRRPPGGRAAPRDYDGDEVSDVDEMLAGTDWKDSCDPNPDCAACLAIRPPNPTPLPKPTPTPVVPPTLPPVATPTSTPTPMPTPEEPGFEAVFAIAGLLAVAYLVPRKKRK